MDFVPQFVDLECSRCGEYICPEPIYACQHGHLACEECKKVVCPICRHDFGDRSEEILRGELRIIPTKRLRARNPFPPNDGTIEFGENFPLPRRGQCRYYAAVDGSEYVFSWKMKPQDGTIIVDVSPQDTVDENWFVVEFIHPSDENRIFKKEWAVNHRLIMNYHDIELLYEMNFVLCRIHVYQIPFGNAVKPFENKLLDAIKWIFKPKTKYEPL